MDYVGINAIKQAYAQKLIENGEAAAGTAVYNKDFSEPVFNGIAFHPEAEPVAQTIDNALEEVTIDFLALNKELSHIGGQYSDLIHELDARLSSVKERIETQKNRLHDVNIICGQYTEFDTVIPLTESNLVGGYVYDNGLISCPRSDKKDISLTVMSVIGNGSESSSTDYLLDNDHTFEYSRYNSDKKENTAYVVNQDNAEAECFIILRGSDYFNAVKIEAVNAIIINGVQTSEDGINFESMLNSPIYLKDDNRKYTDENYIFSAGTIPFPRTKYVKLHVTSNGISSTSGGTQKHTIKIGKISANSAKYKSTTIQTNNLIDSTANSVALFVNEYVPAGFTGEQYLQYILTINGKDHEIVPVNSSSDGTKMIKSSKLPIDDAYVTRINDTIRTVKLKIIMKADGSSATPYIANLKLCVGKGE